MFRALNYTQNKTPPMIVVTNLMFFSFSRQSIRAQKIGCTSEVLRDGIETIAQISQAGET